MLSQNDPIIIIQVSPYYGLVVFVGIASGILLTWQAIQVPNYSLSHFECIYNLYQ